MVTGDGGLRERKKRETRLALSHAAIRLAVQHGLDNVSVEDIAAEANVSERTFRNYFASKAEAIVATHIERGQRIGEVLRQRPTDEPLWDALVNAVLAQFETAGGQPPDGYAAGLQKVLAEPSVQREVFRAHAMAQDELTAAIADRTNTDAEKDLYPQIVAAVVSAGLGLAMGRWARDPSGSLVALLHEVFDQIRAGLPDPR
jgi:AcrR family transcriptional regulator